MLMEAGKVGGNNLPALWTVIADSPPVAGRVFAFLDLGNESIHSEVTFMAGLSARRHINRDTGQ